MEKKIVYAEPADYFPKKIRKKYKLGEYADEGVKVDLKATVEATDNTVKAEGAMLLRLKDFDEALPKEDIITKIKYSFFCFGDFTKNESLVIDISSKDRVRIEYSSWKTDGSIQPVAVLDEADSKALITKLADLNLLEWQEHYEPKEMILDGESWDMEIDTYNLGHIQKGGNNAFPHNWNRFVQLKKWLLSKLTESE